MSRKSIHIALAVRTDGMAPGIHSMIDLAATVVEPGLSRRFEARLMPIADQFNREHLARQGISREQTYQFPAADGSTMAFYRWFNAIAPEIERFRGLDVICWAFEPSLSYGWISHYLHRFVGRCPVAPTVRRIGDYRAGLTGIFEDPDDWRIVPDMRASGEADLAAGALLALPGIAIDRPAPALMAV